MKTKKSKSAFHETICNFKSCYFLKKQSFCLFVFNSVLSVSVFIHSSSLLLFLFLILQYQTITKYQWIFFSRRLRNTLIFFIMDKLLSLPIPFMYLTQESSIGPTLKLLVVQWCQVTQRFFESFYRGGIL